MKKAFLSHSSKDKDKYVRRVAIKLGLNKCIIDEWCFEGGMMNMEEIVRNLKASDLFVIFLSKDALKSEWVQKELILAKNYAESGILDRIYPIIIDIDLKHDDPLFVDNGLVWLTKDYNLQYNARPATAARRITQRLIELQWNENPTLKANKLYFSGRNNLITEIEERFDDYEHPYPVTVIASGLTGIGRRSLLSHTFRKKNIYSDSYAPSSIHLSGRQGIDDFILGLNDLSLTSEIPTHNLLSKTQDEKLIDIIKALNELYDSKESILIIDDGAIVQNNSELADWFEELLKNQFGKNRILFQVVSKFRLHKRNQLNNQKPYLYGIEVPELNEKERRGFFKDLLEFNSISLFPEQFSRISNHLKGLPEEIFFVIEIIKDRGVEYLIRHLGMISDFRSERVSKIIAEVRQEERDFQFLNLLSHFPSFSFELLLSIEIDEDYCEKMLEKFSSLNILEYLGSKDYMRINDVISDPVNRLHIELYEEYKKNIQKLSSEFIKESKLDSTDLSEFYFITKEILLESDSIPEEYLIPSILLNTLADVYERKKDYQRVILLAERILINTEIKDINILRETRYWLCLALARERNSDRFFKELNYVHKNDKFFLLGFYHRLIGQYDTAIDYIKKSLMQRPNFKRAKSELVNALISKEDYATAIDIAKENYEYSKNNPFNIHNYLRCLIITKSEEEELIESLFKELEAINTDKANEMFLLTKARHLAIKQDRKALDFVKEAISKYNDSFYVVLAMLEVAEKLKEYDLLKYYLAELNNICTKRKWLKDTYKMWEEKYNSLASK